MIYDSITVGPCCNSRLNVTVDTATGGSRATSLFIYDRSALAALMSHLQDKLEMPPYCIAPELEHKEYELWNVNSDLDVIATIYGESGSITHQVVKMSKAVKLCTKFTVEGHYTFHNVVTERRSTNDVHLNLITFDSVTVEIRGLITAGK